METLLQKALQVPRKKVRGDMITDEHVELAVAWVNGKVTVSQVAVALGFQKKQTAHAGYKLMLALQAGASRGSLVVEYKPKRK